MNGVASLHLVDRELRAALALFPTFTLSDEHLPLARSLLSESFWRGDAEGASGGPQEVMIPAGQASGVRALIYRPAGGLRTKAAVLHVHGGGFVMGSPEMNHERNMARAEKHGCLVLSPAYRLAPEHKCPAALDDIMTALKWMRANAVELGIDPARIVLAGESAGGGLATAAALWNRDHEAVPLAGLALIYPMLDDRTGTTIPPLKYTGEFAWTAEMNRFGWASILQQTPGDPDVPIYAAPARAEVLEGLPPTSILVGALDLFVRENMEFARRLIDAGIPVNFRLYPGAYHGFDAAPGAQVVEVFQRDADENLALLLEGHLRNP